MIFARIERSVRRMINGSAAHGEDYEDTLEGDIVHPSAVVAAAFVVCERSA